jgi:UV DNA damage endonuclease
MNEVRYGVCCIVLSLEDNDPPKKFQRMTYKKFSETPREEAIRILSKRILNNIDVTFHAIKYCYENNYCYRMSSDLFPLITYDKAELSLEQLPDYDEIKKIYSEIRSYLKDHHVRISIHPSEYNVLASENQEAVEKTIKELNFYSKFMDDIGLPSDYNSPINFHINNNKDKPEVIINRFLKNAEKLDDNCWKRIVIENDDKLNCWSVFKLHKYYHSLTGKPITFDYLHYKCHPDGLSEEDAFALCKETWGDYRPLFHYSESREGKNPRAHADYSVARYNVYGNLGFDLDFEFKMKEKAIEKFKMLV